MAKISKQDRQSARTPTDLEYKYAFTKNIALPASASTEAQRAARESAAAASSAYNSAKNIENEFYLLFTKDHEMTGVLTCTTSAYIPPGDVEIDTITKHVNGTDMIPSTSISLYDFNSSGAVDTDDIALAKSFKNDLSAFKAWQGAVETDVTVTLNLNDPEHVIKCTGVNMWGRPVEGHVGIELTTVICKEAEDRLSTLEEKVARIESALGINDGG